MTFARLGQATHAEPYNISRSHSNFEFVDSLLPDADYGTWCPHCLRTRTLMPVELDIRRRAVRRLFSLARRGRGGTVLIEDIEAVGAVADEIAELSVLFPNYECTGLKRLTFWRAPFVKPFDVERLSDADLIGYAILKHDLIPDTLSHWHIFESVFQKYEHEHNCVPSEPTFTVRCGNRDFHVEGVMYCQQNGLNKACAQVALRSLLSRIFLDQDIPYSDMNRIAREAEPGFAPADGLSTPQIRAVLESYDVKYNDLDYLEESVAPLPYSRILYAGIENGLGGLMGFESSGAAAHGEKHIIPFYGHTFNQDTWVPRASLAYFHVGDKTKYISSEEWMSSFIGHDDNFGNNYCVPRKFLEPSQVKYVVALRPQKTEYGAVAAEALAADCLYSTLDALNIGPNYWTRRLILHIVNQDVVLRTLYVNRDQYVAHLRESRDWQERAEDPSILDILSQALPDHLWMVEISIPELFPANYRKLGEILLDARVTLDPYPSYKELWVMARFPGRYLINDNPMPESDSFTTLGSVMESHTSLYRGLAPDITT